MTRLDEYMVRFDRAGASIEEDESCNLDDTFDFCMVVTDEYTGSKKKHYFDDLDESSVIVENYKRISNKGHFTWKLYNKKGDVYPEWKEIM